MKNLGLINLLQKYQYISEYKINLLFFLISNINLRFEHILLSYILKCVKLCFWQIAHMTSGSQDFFVILVISLTGLLVPVHSLLLLLVSTDRIDREWGCQLQLLTFYSLNVLFLNSSTSPLGPSSSECHSTALSTKVKLKTSFKFLTSLLQAVPTWSYSNSSSGWFSSLIVSLASSWRP